MLYTKTKVDRSKSPDLSPCSASRRQRRVSTRLEEAAEAARRKLPFGFRLPLCCAEFRLPEWRFTRALEWRSQTKFEGRLVQVGGAEWARQQVRGGGGGRRTWAAAGANNTSV